MNFDLTKEQAIWKSKAETFSRGISSASLSESGMRESQAIADLAERARRDGVWEWRLPLQPGGERTDMSTLVLILEALASRESLLGMAVANQYLCQRSCQLLNAKAWEKILITEYSKATGCFPAALLWPSSDASSFAPPAAVMRQGRLYVEDPMSIAQPETCRYLGLFSAESATEKTQYGFFFAKLEPGQMTKSVVRPLGFGALKTWPLNQVTLDSEFRDAGDLHSFKSEAAYQDFLSQLTAEKRLLLSAILLGVAQASFNYTLEYAKRRVTFGKPIGEHQAVALKIADMQMGIESSRLLLWHAAMSEDWGVNPDMANRAWLYCREVLTEATIQAVQLLGGHGYLNEHPVGRWMCDAQILSLM
jgi:hypothetical protein